MRKPEIQSIQKNGNPNRQTRLMRQVMEKSVEALDDIRQAAQDTDFVLQNGSGNGALKIAHRRGIPVAFANLIPSAPRGDFPPFIVPYRISLGGTYNLLTHKLSQVILWRTVGGPQVNRWHNSLGLPPWGSSAEILACTRDLRTP
jgi:hypothetical protein